MELLPELLKQGGLAIVAASFFWLYFQERKDKKEVQTKYEVSLDARRIDAKQTVDNISAPLSGISQGIKLLTDKIIVGKQENL